MNAAWSTLARALPYAFATVFAATSFAAPTVVIFVIDGLQPRPAAIAAANGAENLELLLERGVTAREAYCTSPAPHLRLPDGSLPWGSSSSPNVAMHTGAHLFESREMDDIFLAARRAGVRSVFAGGAANYAVFTNADFLHANSRSSDAQIVDFAIQHLQHDDVRLLRLHLQRIRDAWRGPEASLDPTSEYQRSIRHADEQLGRLIAALRAAGRWEETFLIVTADHGMGQSSASDHSPRHRSSWEVFLGFLGPGLKRGASIPYAETPDVAIMAAHFLGAGKLRGHLAPTPGGAPAHPTGTFLAHVFDGAPDDLEHPQFIRRYLAAHEWHPPDEYADYRAGMIELIPPAPASASAAAAK